MRRVTVCERKRALFCFARMGKYMRKRSVGRRPPAVELGVRTRARSAAVASAAAVAAAPAPKRPRKQATARAEAEAAVRDGNGGGAAPGCCYLQLRSRSLFMAAAGEVQCPAPPLPAAALQRSVASRGEPVVEVAGISRCSSTASSVDVVVAPAPAPARERSGGKAEEAHEDCDVESVVSDSAGCRRQRRETTPSSRPPVDLRGDEERSQAAGDDPKRHRRRRALATATTTSVACRARMPPAEEIEQFLGAAEKAQAERFAAKYNFDVARGLPLGAGRYEWTPVASG